MQHKKVLILNADFTPIGLINWTKAVTLDHKNLVRVVDYYKDDVIISAGNHKWPAPAVVVLVKYQNPKKKQVPFSRKHVFIRDSMTCQYCKKKFRFEDLTLDHVIPRSKWTQATTCTCWENIVTCCYSCNSKKADMTLEQSGLTLIQYPRKPNPSGFIRGFAPWTKVQPEWVPYLPKTFLDIIN